MACDDYARSSGLAGDRGRRDLASAGVTQPSGTAGPAAAAHAGSRSPRRICRYTDLPTRVAQPTHTGHDPSNSSRPRRLLRIRAPQAVHRELTPAVDRTPDRLRYPPARLARRARARTHPHNAIECALKHEKHARARTHAHNAIECALKHQKRARTRTRRAGCALGAVLRLRARTRSPPRADRALRALRAPPPCTSTPSPSPLTLAAVTA